MFRLEKKNEIQIFMSSHFDKNIGQNDNFDCPFWVTKLALCF